ncbi:MAG: class I SAM-dependent methyltransferase [Bacillota bacterium]|nr:class I SAM-dependent methyltransferase [Bacillota bacterium]
MSHYFDSNPVSEHLEKEIQVRLAGQDFTFITDQSVFSRQKLDAGSKYLIEAILENNLPKIGRILDLGCGYGAIGIILKRLCPALSVVLCDINERAVSLARRNSKLNQVRFIDIVRSDGFEEIEGSFDLILTNPPIRAGKQTVYRFFSDAAGRLNPEGSLYVVIRKQQGAPSAFKKLQELFSDVEVLERKAGYWIIRARSARPEW